MNCTTPFLSEMDSILKDKRSRGLRGVRLFVDKSDDRTHEDIARGYCKMEKAEAAGHFTDLSDVAL